MVKITEELVRKRSEHNEGEISTLEELALHQENIEKLEYLDKWCRVLKILLLQSNLIPKIENVSRLKKLEYLNLALNNIEKVENLEGCESLQKLDLTVNFIGQLTSIECLKNNIHLETLFLTGNPCTDFNGYREYVIATLLQLKNLDGKEIERSERIIAMQIYNEVKKNILYQEGEYKIKRLAQKENAKKMLEEDELEYAAGKDKSQEEREKEFWSKVSDHSPESRQQIAEHIQRQQEELKRSKSPEKEQKRSYKTFSDYGRPLNVNEAKIPFELTENDEMNSYILDIAVYKYLDTSLLEVDFHPTYARVLIKGKIFQIVFNEEIKIENSTAKRSQTTGHLVLTMPKINGEVAFKVERKSVLTRITENSRNVNTNSSRRELLEIGRPTSDDMDFSKIVERNSRNRYEALRKMQEITTEHFIDNPEVPPLE
ncbi:hypothetical protein L9F63_015336 [Diploptera punctata]|uniref:Dynein axonemal assembly factor 11-like CS domain-containing protein n=1 Tax=Diploptera punctata TaxID=6984 RepID=A0AAD8A6L7_DIPPU|nr:hypothetical protein L9F63_015336 [Diploptera punctata]